MHALHTSATVVLLLASVPSGSIKHGFSPWFSIAMGFGTLLLLFGGVPFVIGLLRQGSDRLVTGVAPSGPLPSKSKALLIGPYRIVSIIGTGGMGTVFKGVDSQGRAFAIKVIGGSQMKGTALIRAKKKADFRIGLVREAKLASELRHPNIVEIHDIGQHRGTLYVVMELLDGMPLDRYAKTHPVSAPEALRIVAQLCDALECAHSQGVVHRDVKPANTFIATDGTVKVLDFGIALPPDESQALGSVIGTPLYMSPEQIMGQDVDGRADIWSAGVTLFQLLTTKTPFQGNSTAELRARILTSPTPNLPFVGEFAEELNRLLQKALAKDRQQRYSSAREFADDLRSVMRKMQKSETAAEPGPVVLNSTPKASVAVRSNYAPIRLGFHAQLKGPVLLFPFPVPKRYEFPLIRALFGLIACSLAIVVPARTLLAIAGFHDIDVAAVGIGAFFCIVLAVLLCLSKLVAFLDRRRTYRCRSCRRRMLRVSAWSRPTWLSEQNSLCVPDCIAALKSGLWEEAVRLLWLHTSKEKSERHYNLEFFECARCGDQRAYLTLGVDSQGSWEIRGLREAYKFGNPENAQQYLKSGSTQALSNFSEAALAATAVVDNRIDLHDQPTV